MQKNLVKSGIGVVLGLCVLTGLISSAEAVITMKGAEVQDGVAVLAGLHGGISVSPQEEASTFLGNIRGSGQAGCRILDACPPASILPLPPGEGRVRARQSQGEGLRYL